MVLETGQVQGLGGRFSLVSQDEILKNLLLGVDERQCDAQKCCSGSRVRSAPQLAVTLSKYDGIGK